MPTLTANDYRFGSLSTADLLALARALESASGPIDGLQKRALVRLQDAAAALAAEWEKEDAPKPPNARDADTLVDRAHGAIDARLEAYALLADVLDAKDVEDAARIRARLYPDGLGFLKRKFAEEWAESDKRVRRIREEHLETALRRLAGKDFVDALYVAHERYGAALGITKPDATVRASVLEPHRAVTAAIEQYVRVVLGTVLDDDDESVDLARRRLRPIEATQERLRSAPQGSAANGPIEPATPHPPDE